MSWSGFKKSLNRAGTTLMQKTGQVDRTVDREFQEEEARYKTLEKQVGALQKESKAYLDAMRAATASQARIAESLDNFYGDASEAAMASHSYRAAVGEMDSITSKELDAPFRATVLEPIGKFCSYFPEINSTLTKRGNKLIDYDSARTKVRKLVDKPNEDGLKLQRAEKECEDAKEVFEAINGQIVNELPQLLDLRIPYLDPSFEAMVRLQAQFAEQSYQKLSGVQRYFPDQVRDDYANGQLDAQVEGALQELRDLSICGMER